MSADVAPVQRIDQWLWFARLIKSRTLAQGLITRGKVRLNRARVEKASATLKPGDVLTLTLGPKVRIVEVMAIGVRRGPAKEAQLLFRDLSPVAQRSTPDQASREEIRLGAQAVREDGTGRPAKRERRQTDRLKDRFRPL